MPVHDWRRVEAGIFHDFHNAWTTHLKEALNAGILPAGYYALAEQHANEVVADVLTLHDASERAGLATGSEPVALLESPPKVGRKLVGSFRPSKRRAQRRVTVRHVSNHRVVALIEVVSPANKDRPASVRTFAQKVRDSLELGVNVLLVDLFPPGQHDRGGMHGAIWKSLGDELERPTDEQPLCAISYVAKAPPEAYLAWFAVGLELPSMPLFLNTRQHIDVPLQATYQTTYQGVPDYWRSVVEQAAEMA